MYYGHLSMDKTKPCIACFEPIRSEATLCHFCSTSQKPSRWKLVSHTLKWIGGIITVISLIGGTITLARHYSDWQEKRDTLADLVGAADWLIKAQNYPQAWMIYNEAIKLDPVSTQTRLGQGQLAKVWLRNFKAKKDQLDNLLNDISITLYRSLRSDDSDETASTLAHAGWVQILRVENRLPVTVDIDLLYLQALSENPNDVYANAMYGYWILLKRGGTTLEKLKQAQSRFTIALATGDARSFVRRLQISSLRDYSFGQSDEIEQETLKIQLRIVHSMMNNAEKKFSLSRRLDILNTYGIMGRGEHIESSLSALSPDEHLAVLDWLMEGIDYKSRTGQERSLHQFNYLKARLTEASGKRDDALLQYKALLRVKNAAKELNKLVDKGIKRLTGSFPPRTLARNYLNDPVDIVEPWPFHLQTLLHFDPKWQGTNFTQALAFFESQIDQPVQPLSTLLEVIAKTTKRIVEIIRTGDEIARRNEYTSGFGAFDHENARANFYNLGVLHQQIFLAMDNQDAAIAVLNDLKQLTESLGERWFTERVEVTFELARVHALRASKKNNPQDIKKALGFLQNIIQSGGVGSESVNWEQIKGDDFKALFADPDYKQMVRGR